MKTFPEKSAANSDDCRVSASHTAPFACIAMRTPEGLFEAYLDEAELIGVVAQGRTALSELRAASGKGSE